MDFDPGLEIGEEINNDRLCEIFLCSGQGGMRKSNKTNTLVIVSKHVGRIYDDRWIGETLHYTGMGLEGDQEIHLSQNKTLSQSKTNGVDLHLFEKFKEREYTYRGRVELSGEPYEERQPDLKGNIRRVWMFPLRVKDRDHFSIDLTIQRGLEKKKEKKARKLYIEELKKRVKFSPKVPGNRDVKTKTYERSSIVSELAKRRAGGRCQLCLMEAPFKTKDGSPFLETHHIVWLSNGGEDTPENTVALCPNCHRKMHSLNLKKDRDFLIYAATGNKF
tara:strand:- start:2055 stop:2882 length:828 start_codon:yes stop_codon:yes gene_type:complete